jgi:Leucine-rich repeat (LRR) protein
MISDLKFVSFFATGSFFQSTATTLDISSLGLIKLKDIDEFGQLVHLSIRNNKLTTLSPIRQLTNLRFLDASENCISKIDQLPESIETLLIAGNSVGKLDFCEKMPVSLFWENLNSFSMSIRRTTGSSCTI